MEDEFNKVLANIGGLTDQEVSLSKEMNGVNQLSKKKKEPFILKILKIFK